MTGADYVVPGHPVKDGAGYDCQCGECLLRRQGVLPLTPSERSALSVLAAGDAYVEGHATTAEHGGIVNVSTARALERKGLIETYEKGRICPWVMARINDSGALALSVDGAHIDGSVS